MTRDEFLASASQRSSKNVSDERLPLPLQFRTKPYIIEGRKDSDTQLKNQHTLVPAGAKRPQSSYSTSTNNSSEAFTHPHRLPAGSHRWSVHQVRAWTKCFHKWKTAYEEISGWPENSLEPYGGACENLSGGENTLNQVAPQSDFKITKGRSNVYTYKATPATPSTATTVPTALPTHTITKPYSATRLLCEPACFRARRNSLLRRRSSGRIG
ncbi:hypothetical protein JMJ35_000393 [Cladonia borealis]|uniref:Uncharacterized protein n=1 Tax=Cladonia borealis TaxID=184061 RepID=A0AA39RBH1_9LECA|nr:hypothetical protein JMJ35_000393 [Cladonia borealis]